MISSSGQKILHKNIQMSELDKFAQCIYLLFVRHLQKTTSGEAIALPPFTAAEVGTNGSGLQRKKEGPVNISPNIDKNDFYLFRTPLVSSESGRPNFMRPALDVTMS